MPTVNASWQGEASVSLLLPSVFCYCCVGLAHKPIVFHLPYFSSSSFPFVPSSWISAASPQAQYMPLFWSSAVIRAALLWDSCILGAIAISPWAELQSKEPRTQFSLHIWCYLSFPYWKEVDNMDWSKFSTFCRKGLLKKSQMFPVSPSEFLSLHLVDREYLSNFSPEDSVQRAGRSSEF